ncbi:hypothetical protein J2X45_003938 [Caulobacter sp. BE264]|uniref:phage tail tube protein n=1 Tax=Caulobacter sp. BE264 TaxID=2817724 RepID=UPI00285E6EE0|nr:phage tail tube protein [Caulobacter sp. BE264]MDR7232828.1 hypothetical protein [Caulobacter sp. BE264]
MAQAQGIARKIARVKQSGKGTAGSSGSQLIRRTSATFNKVSETYENNEIADHQQSTGSNEGVYATTGQVEGLLSAGTYAPEFACLLRKDFAATSAITGMTIAVAGSGPTYTITRSAGDFLTGGIKIGDVVKLTAGSFNAANLNKNLWVVGMTATVLTVVPVNGAALVAESGITSASLAVPGKKAWVPTTGHTSDYYSYEVWQPDVPSSELYVDCKTVQADISVPATGNPTVSFSIPGLSRVNGSSQVLTSPTAATTTPVLATAQGLISLNGSLITVTSVDISISGNVNPGEAEIGSKSRSDHQMGRVMVSGSFSAKFTSTAIQAIRDAQTPVALAVIVAADATAAADFVTFVIPAIKIFTDEANDGEVEIIRTYQWTAQIPATGGASLSNHQTIVSIQDAQAA